MIDIMARAVSTGCFRGIHDKPSGFCGYFDAFFGCILILLPVFASTGSLAGQGPEDVVYKMSQGTIDEITSNRAELTREPGLLYKLIETTSVPYFDVDTISRLVLGKYWRTATSEKRKRFTLAFKHLVINSYASALLNNNTASINVLPVSARKPDKGRVTVHSIVTTKTGKTIDISYRLRQVSAEWKIYDVSIEGVSLVLNYKHSFAEQIRQNGLDGLINQIEEKNTQYQQ